MGLLYGSISKTAAFITTLGNVLFFFLPSKYLQFVTQAFYCEEKLR